MLGFKKNLAEIARIVRIDKSTAQNKKDEIEGYLDEVITTTDDDIKFIQEKSIELGISGCVRFTTICT